MSLTVKPGVLKLDLSWTLTAKTYTAIVMWRKTGDAAWNQMLPPTTLAATLTGLEPVSYDIEVLVVPSGSSMTAKATPLPVPVPKSSGVDVSVLNGSTRAYLENDTIGKALQSWGVKTDRIDIGDGRDAEKWMQVAHALTRGWKVLPMYNPGDGQSGGITTRADGSTITPADCVADVLAIVGELQTLGAFPLGSPPVLELGNEVSYNGGLPAPYAAQYSTVQVALKGSGVKLIASATGDYAKADGTWSKTVNGNGWIGDFCQALPGGGASVDAWGAHPYPPPTGGVTGMSSEKSGWPAIDLYRKVALQHGSDAPFYLTETGMRSDQYTEAQRAAGITEMLNGLVNPDPAITGTPYSYVVFFGWYSSTDGPWSIFDPVTGAPLPTALALQSWLAKHPNP